MKVSEALGENGTGTLQEPLCCLHTRCQHLFSHLQITLNSFVHEEKQAETKVALLLLPVAGAWRCEALQTPDPSYLVPSRIILEPNS